MRTREREHSPASHYSLYRLDQLGRVVTNPIFENDLRILNVFDLARRVTLDHHQIGLFADPDGADAIRFAEVLSPVCSSDMDGFQRSESCFHQQLDLALI